MEPRPVGEGSDFSPTVISRWLGWGKNWLKRLAGYSKGLLFKLHGIFFTLIADSPIIYVTINPHGRWTH